MKNINVPLWNTQIFLIIFLPDDIDNVHINQIAHELETNNLNYSGVCHFASEFCMQRAHKSESYKTDDKVDDEKASLTTRVCVWVWK